MAVAEEYDKTLKATDPRFKRAVQIIHEEGTTYFFHHAFLMRWKDPEHKHNPQNADEHQGIWLMVFTEHQHFHVFAPGDLTGWAQFDRIYDIENMADGNDRDTPETTE